MLDLAIDTVMNRCGVAVGRDGVADDAEIAAMERGHAEALAPMIARVLARVGARVCDLRRIVVTTGPGSFTGVRIGVAMARGLAVAGGAHLVGVNALAAVAAACDHPGPLLVVHDARRGGVYAQGFHGRDPEGLPLERTSAHLATRDEALALAQRLNARLIGSAALLVAPERALDHNPQIDPKVLLRFAQGRVGVAHSALLPLYLRAADAKLPASTPIERLGESRGRHGRS